ncbi:hypothetical protein NXY02_14910 [Bacteroides fragilis]|nr:hypothetical protein [Bacteroides fragilis]
MSELKITQEKVTAAFSEANDCPKAISILTALFGKQKPDYTDYHNIKTYEDACEAVGVKPIVRLLVEDEDGHKEEVADITHLAYIKLCTIARALNNDPDFPRFTKDEYRYTPWFYLYNQKKLMKWTKRIVIGWFSGAVLRITVRFAASLLRTRLPLGRTRVRFSALALL